MMGRSASSKSFVIAGSSEPFGTVRLSKLHLAVETGPLAGVAGRANRIDEEQNRVLVAVDEDLLDAQVVARGFALRPQLLAGAAPERDKAQVFALAPRVLVQDADHQHLARLVM